MRCASPHSVASIDGRAVGFGFRSESMLVVSELVIGEQFGRARQRETSFGSVSLS